MPSDPRTAQALSALAQPIAEFRTLIQGALAQAQDFLAAQSADAAVEAARAGAELGPFAAGRMDAAAFAKLFPSARRVDAAAIDALKRAIDELRAVSLVGDDLFLVRVPAGARLATAVGDTLGLIGRAFGAVVLTEIVRGGRYVPAEHDRLLDDAGFQTWTRAERRIAPPLVVEVDGADVQAAALTDFADGREKLVLVVKGPAAPAPLARCISPGTFVLQTVDGSGLDRAAAFDGPAIAALMPQGSAVFLHDPLAGREPWQRITVQHLPEAPRRAIRGLSAFQMSEELRLLSDAARTPFAVPTAAGAGAPAVGASEAVDRLASWLLTQSGLNGQG
ncbi:MAG: hypothetical protein KGL38_05035 [Gemmatimonadota bacterium]|nr:hypothetical protein [Gemmatimonadota bacterium]MDE3127347.1 hypothetical protein [Gemmatimonadota bacterium]